MLVRAALVAVAVAAVLALPTDLDIEDFETYCAVFGKNYASEEHNFRRTQFERNIQLIKDHNSKSTTSRYGVNPYTDWTTSEMKSLKGFSGAMHRTRTVSRQRVATSQPLVPRRSRPDSVDWVKAGATTAVKNQGGCGSCWAFAATEAIESDYYLNAGKKIVLAPQTFVNCVDNPKHCGGTGGCEGATPDLAFVLANTTGVATEQDLPYEQRDEKCQAYTPAVYVDSFVDVSMNDPDALMDAVVDRPVTVGVAANAWGLYSSGVLSFEECDAEINHAVLLVGYGTDKKHGDYWKIQNSWGTMWGEGGFIRVARSSKDATNCKNDTATADGFGCTGDPSWATVCGTCGLLYAPSYPTGTHAA